MRILWQYKKDIGKFHGYRAGEFSSLCGIPRGGNPPIAESDAIPPESRCLKCDIIAKREQKKFRAEISRPLSIAPEQNAHEGEAQGEAAPVLQNEVEGTDHSEPTPVEVDRIEDKEPCEHGPETVQDGRVDGPTPAAPELDQPPTEIEAPKMEPVT